MASYYRSMLLCTTAITLVACNIIGICKADTISDVCKSAASPQFCTTSVRNANGGPSDDLKKISVIAVDLTSVEVTRVHKLLPQLNASDCSDIFSGTKSEIEKVEIELRGVSKGNFQTVIADVQNGLNDLEKNINDCYVKLKELGKTEVIPSVVNSAVNLTLLISDAQSFVNFLSQRGPP